MKDPRTCLQQAGGAADLEGIDMPIMTEDITLAERIEDSDWDVDDNGCWIWRGQYHGQRAKLSVNEGTMNASKAMWVATYGKVHPLLEVCHACHNSSCVNINHLYLANHTRNMADAGSAAPLLPHAGEQPVRIRRTLNPNDIGRLVWLFDSRMLHLRELAKLFDVTQRTIRNALLASDTTRAVA